MGTVVRIALALAILMLAGCTGRPTDSLTTDTASSTIEGDAAKVAFLARYLKLRSEVTATEFHIVYRDNSQGGVPGPSDWDIRAVMQVPPDQLQRWAEGRSRVTGPVELTWGYDLAASHPDWVTDRPPEVYEGGGATVALFPDAGIVFFRSTTMP